jgi:CubicO group peptidase (beta-lactamase class C family)
VEELVDRVARETGFSGVVRVDQGDQTFAKAYGLADRRHGIAMSVDSQLAVASGGKGFTALAVLSLVEEGRLRLTTRAREVLGPDLPLIADDVTVEHLLSHRSGIGDYLDEETLDDVAEYVMPLSAHVYDTTEAYLPWLDGHPTKFPAGERFAYCNGGYVVLALIAERVAGTGFHDLVRAQVIRPAGLADTDFLRSDELPARAALGYVSDTRTNVFHLPVLGNGDGGIYTTAADLRRFWTALFAGRIVTDATVADLTTKRSDEYGLGFWLPDGRVSLVGGDAGVSFTSRHDPATGGTITVIGNTSDGAWPVGRAVRDAVDSGQPRVSGR